MSSGKAAQANETKTVELPAWVSDASQSNYKLAQDVANRDYAEYTGPRVASESPLTTQGYGLLQKNIGATDPLYALSKDSLGRSTGLQGEAADVFRKAGAEYDAISPLYAKAVGAAEGANKNFAESADIYRNTAGPLDIKPYLNPYTDEVVNRSVDQAERSLQGNLNTLSDKARAASAFGGSRQGITEGVAIGEGVRNVGDLTAQLRRAGIDFATNTALADRTGRQAAAAGITNAGSGMLNSGAGFLGAAGGMRENAAGTMGVGSGLLAGSAAAGNTASGYRDTATGQNAANLQDLQSLFTGGQQQQQLQQKNIDAEMARFAEERNYPVEQLNLRLAALGMSPYGKTETGSKTSTAEQLPTDWASVALGAAKIGAQAISSDRKSKTDIQKLGKDPASGIPMYSYRYKDDPKTYPKVVGPMAQDIEKKFPSAVKKVGAKKHKVVNLSNLMEVLS